jgi:hypothetical protein
MLKDLILFLPLAVLTNTAFPVPFDPVLMSFASTHTRAEACVFAVLGSLCAAGAALLDTRVLGRVGAALGVSGKGVGGAPCRRWFYALTFAVALLPLPFSLVRLALMRARPDPAKYAVAVGLGRLPRYLATVFLWQGIAAPSWVGQAILPAAIAIALVQYWLSRRRTAPDELSVAG